jgi:hypothetical protein
VSSQSTDMAGKSTDSGLDVDRTVTSLDELASERSAWTRRRRLNLQVLGVYAALLVLCVVLTVLSP